MMSTTAVTTSNSTQLMSSDETVSVQKYTRNDMEYTVLKLQEKHPTSEFINPIHGIQGSIKATEALAHLPAEYHCLVDQFEVSAEVLLREIMPKLRFVVSLADDMALSDFHDGSDTSNKLRRTQSESDIAGRTPVISEALLSKVENSHSPVTESELNKTELQNCSVTALLNDMSRTYQDLPKTILFTLNY